MTFFFISPYRSNFRFESINSRMGPTISISHIINNTKIFFSESNEVGFFKPKEHKYKKEKKHINQHEKGFFLIQIFSSFAIVSDEFVV